MNIVLQVGGLAQERVARSAQIARSLACLGSDRAGLRRGGEPQIVGTIGNQFVTKCVFDLVVLQQKRARHPLYVARGKSDKIALEPGHQHARDAFAVQILAQFGASQSKRFIELSVGIGKARQIVQMIGSEKFRSALFRAQVHERNLRPLPFDLRTKFR